MCDDRIAQEIDRLEQELAKARHAASEWKRLYEQQREYTGRLPVTVETLEAQLTTANEHIDLLQQAVDFAGREMQAQRWSPVEDGDAALAAWGIDVSGGGEVIDAFGPDGPLFLPDGVRLYRKVTSDE